MCLVCLLFVISYLLRFNFYVLIVCFLLLMTFACFLMFNVFSLPVLDLALSFLNSFV
ncbi:hypothetical protein OUM_1252 [Helicobacter pylori R038b]|uniref:Uncharacterized protein n=1 Tax=Helicobacter pylori R038b TaxID=1145115 RepID=K2L4X7_HELPX|nr:hypothetical protein OUM_1252 [Helicobacter pylori R038b]